MENDDLTRRLERLPASVVHDALRAQGDEDPALPATIRPLSPGLRVAGPVFTVAGREAEASAHETLLAWATLLSAIPPGSVVVCQPRTKRVALMGELSARALRVKGVRGYVVDGLCRDLDLVEEAGLPVFCTGATPADIVRRWLPDPAGQPIEIGGRTIAAGDYVIGDRDGVVTLPRARAAAAVAEAERMLATESEMRRAILAGMDPREAYLAYGKF
ncbi:MAG: RraA family protein [Dongiaceae bacterium]